VLARVVRAGADGDQAAISEPLDTVGADGVRSDHHAQVVSLQELVQVVGSKVNDVVLLLRISGEVVLEALGLLALMWIGPEEVDDLLVVLRLVTTQFDLKWSCNSSIPSISCTLGPIPPWQQKIFWSLSLTTAASGM